MTTFAANPPAPAAGQERHRLIMADECGWLWLVLLGGLARQATRVAEADRERAALLATVSHDRARRSPRPRRRSAVCAPTTPG